MKFQDDISNMNIYVRTYIHTYIRTSRNQYAPPLFQSWGHNKTSNCTCKGFTEVLFLLLLSLTAVVVMVIIFYVFLKKIKMYLALREKRQLWMRTYSANPRKYTVFLAFCSENDNFVMKYIFTQT